MTKPKSKVSVPCQECGVITEKFPSQIQQKTFCSRECQYAYPKTHRTEIFWSHVDQTGECWLWQGHKDRDGYGKFGVEYHGERAHRMAWELTYGPIPDEFLVCHACDTPGCVRPAHLWLGRHKDNIHDAMRKQRRAVGERHPRATLSDIEAATILARKGNQSVGELAQEFGVTRYVIRHIQDGHSYKAQTQHSCHQGQ